MRPLATVFAVVVVVAETAGVGGLYVKLRTRVPLAVAASLPPELRALSAAVALLDEPSRDGARMTKRDGALREVLSRGLPLAGLSAEVEGNIMAGASGAAPAPLSRALALSPLGLAVAGVALAVGSGAALLVDGWGAWPFLTGWLGVLLACCSAGLPWRHLAPGGGAGLGAFESDWSAPRSRLWLLDKAVLVLFPLANLAIAVLAGVMLILGVDEALSRPPFLFCVGAALVTLALSFAAPILAHLGQEIEYDASLRPHHRRRTHTAGEGRDYVELNDQGSSDEEDAPQEAVPPRPRRSRKRYRTRLERAFEPRYKRPYFLWTASAVQLVLLLAAIVYDGGPSGLLHNPLVGPSFSTIYLFGAKWGPAISRDGQIWRLFTAPFMHVGLIHYGLNMLFQLRAAPALELIYGPWRIGLIYMLAGAGGNILSCVFMPLQLGAGSSSSLFGILGVIVSDLVQNAHIIPNRGEELLRVLGSVLFSLIVGLLPGIDNFVHLGGFFVGFCCGFVVLPTMTFSVLTHSEYTTRLCRIRVSLTHYSSLSLSLFTLLSTQNRDQAVFCALGGPGAALLLPHLSLYRLCCKCGRRVVQGLPLCQLRPDLRVLPVEQRRIQPWHGLIEGHQVGGALEMECAAHHTPLRHDNGHDKLHGLEQRSRRHLVDDAGDATACVHVGRRGDGPLEVAPLCDLECEPHAPRVLDHVGSEGGRRGRGHNERHARRQSAPAPPVALGRHSLQLAVLQELEPRAERRARQVSAGKVECHSDRAPRRHGVGRQHCGEGETVARGDWNERGTHPVKSDKSRFQRIAGGRGASERHRDAP